MSNSQPFDDLPTNGTADDDMLSSIIKRFVRLVGTATALNVARRVPGLVVDDEGNVVAYDRGEPSHVIQRLLDEYKAIFGEIPIVSSHPTPRPSPALAATIKTSATRIALIDDHVLVREGLAGLINSQVDMSVVGQAGTVHEAIALFRTVQPDLILMDVSLPDGAGQDAARAILKEHPSARIIFLSVHEDDEQLFSALRTGAVGYLFKSMHSAEILARIRGAARGEAALSLTTARRVLVEFSRLPEPPIESALSTELTQREIEIMREVARGATNREIAQRLTISTNTVRNHVRNILSKLHLHSRRDVGMYAREHGFAA